MTRKNALLKAISILKAQNQDDLCDILNNILNDIPFTHWNHNSIIDSIEQFIIENHRLPRKKELETNSKLPNLSVIANKYGCSYVSFFKKYFKEYIDDDIDETNLKYHYRSKKYWKENFIEQYNNLNLPTRNDYDKLRDKNSPRSRTLLKIVECKSWNELLLNCGFEIKQKQQKESRQTFEVNVIHSNEVNEIVFDNIALS